MMPEKVREKKRAEQRQRRRDLETFCLSAFKYCHVQIEPVHTAAKMPAYVAPVLPVVNRGRCRVVRSPHPAYAPPHTGNRRNNRRKQERSRVIESLISEATWRRGSEWCSKDDSGLYTYFYKVHTREMIAVGFGHTPATAKADAAAARIWYSQTGLPEKAHYRRQVVECDTRLLQRRRK